MPSSIAASHNAVIRFYDDAGNVIQTHEHKSEFKGILTAVPAL
jgi:hypothetical protein